MQFQTDSQHMWIIPIGKRTWAQMWTVFTVQRRWIYARRRLAAVASEFKLQPRQFKREHVGNFRGRASAAGDACCNTAVTHAPIRTQKRHSWCKTTFMFGRQPMTARGRRRCRQSMGLSYSATQIDCRLWRCYCESWALVSFWKKNRTCLKNQLVMIKICVFLHILLFIHPWHCKWGVHKIIHLCFTF